MLKFDTKPWSSRTPILEDIITDKATGIVFTDVLTHTQCDHLISVIDQLKPDFFTDLNNQNGFSLPGMFGQLHKTQPVELVDKYFSDIDPFKNATTNAAGNDVGMLVEELLASAFAPYNTSVLKGLLPYSFRVVFPKRGGLFIHKDGSLLPYIHDVVGKDIEQRIYPETMMSWYFTLQQPQGGGELWVADKSFSVFEKDGAGGFKNPAGDTIQEEDMVHLTIPTPKGSLLMFKGGNHWHKVPPPTPDSINRITLGGFMALGRSNNEIFYWS